MELVSKMETLNETQQGKLKGGITTLSSKDLSASLDQITNTGNCQITNNGNCQIVIKTL